MAKVWYRSPLGVFDFFISTSNNTIFTSLSIPSTTILAPVTTEVFAVGNCLRVMLEGKCKLFRDCTLRRKKPEEFTRDLSSMLVSRQCVRVLMAVYIAATKRPVFICICFPHVWQVVDEQVLKPPDSFLAMTRPAQFAEEMQYRSMSLQKVISIFVRPLFPALNHSAFWPFGSRQLSLIQTSYLCLREQSPEKKKTFIQLNCITFHFRFYNARCC